MYIIITSTAGAIILGMITGLILTGLILYGADLWNWVVRKKKYYYFVAYQWSSDKQRGHGNIEITLTNPIQSYDDIKIIQDYLNSNTTDGYDDKTNCLLLSVYPLSKKGKKPVESIKFVPKVVLEQM